jgi:hypothetical protein
LDEAPSVITEGAGLPLAGALPLLPALATTGLVEVAETVYQPSRAAFYGLRSLVFAAVAGAARAEGLVVVPRRVVSKVRASVPDRSSEVLARRLSWDSVRTSRRC